MRHAATLIITAIAVFASAPRARAQINIPGPGDGYLITRTDFSNVAVAGYEGRTDGSTQTAVGNTPATRGKRFVTRFTLGNQIEVCPQADGTSEGDGTFSISFDYTDAQPAGTSTTHVDMRATAHYRGKVGDDAMLDNPVYAEMDFTYHQTGTMRAACGAIATSPPSDVIQHISIPFSVAKGMNVPSIGPFAGGDPTKGHYAQAIGVGTALVYWGGVYWSIAETRWTRPNACAQITFDPPSHSRQPVLGGETKVNAEVRTKSGEISKGKFSNAHVYMGAGAVSPLGGSSDLGSPLQFTYTAPARQVSPAGFRVEVLSRAGVAQGEWETGLGTGWSGQITASRVVEGDNGSSDLQKWTNYEATRVTIDVRNGVGIARGFTETRYSTNDKQKALRGGAIVLIDAMSGGGAGTLDAESPAKVFVDFREGSGTYQLGVEYDPFAAGKKSTYMCRRSDCTTEDMPLSIASILPTMSGKVDDPNHVTGSKTEVAQNLGKSGRGRSTFTVRWDLARQGSAP